MSLVMEAKCLHCGAANHIVAEGSFLDSVVVCSRCLKPIGNWSRLARVGDKPELPEAIIKP